VSETPAIPTWINGQPDDRLPVSDRGLAYGDGLFETILITNRGPVLLEYHLERLMLGAGRLGIPLDRNLIEKDLHAYPGLQSPGVVKLIVTRGSGGRGYATNGVGVPTCILSSHPTPVYPSTIAEQGIQLFPCATRLGINPRLAGIKHLNRLEQVLARQEWQGSDDFQEGLMCDIDGHPVEGVMTNLFIVEGNDIVTPMLDQCGVAGVMRRWLMERLRTQGYGVKETQITLDRFRVADERFFCNSVLGVWPVARFEESRWPVGPVSQLAQQLIRSHWF